MKICPDLQCVLPRGKTYLHKGAVLQWTNLVISDGTLRAFNHSSGLSLMTHIDTPCATPTLQFVYFTGSCRVCFCEDIPAHDFVGGASTCDSLSPSIPLNTINFLGPAPLELAPKQLAGTGLRRPLKADLFRRALARPGPVWSLAWPWPQSSAFGV